MANRRQENSLTDQYTLILQHVVRESEEFRRQVGQQQETLFKRVEELFERLSNEQSSTVTAGRNKRKTVEQVPKACRVSNDILECERKVGYQGMISIFCSLYLCF